MKRDFYNEILEAVDDRKDWERAQSAWYRIRHGTTPRRNLPFAGAANLKFKIADSLIEKLKPFYIQQLYSDEVLASFISLKDQDNALTSASAYWFDYKLKQESNFEREIYSGVDQTLESSFIPIKIFWDPDGKRLVFNQCDPLHVIVPKWTEEYEDADWLVHVLHYSECQYRRKEHFNQDDEFIGRIKGKPGEDSSGENEKLQEVLLREGITCGQHEDQIVLWEVYRKEYSKGAPWLVETISPMVGPEEPVGPCFGLPFKHGCLPFCKIRYEITKKGYYATRGVTEITASDESYLNKMWNAKADWMAFTVNPAFEQTGDVPIPNSQNFQRKPGSIMPRGLVMQTPPPAPVELNQEMEFSREHAEYRVQMPDLGAASHMTAGRGGGQADRVTATQINAIVGLSNQSNDLRARIFRLDLGHIFKMSWDVLCQYNSNLIGADGMPDTTSLTYILQGSIKQLDPQALHTDYLITPNGSPDSWNKAGRTQKALTYYQLLITNPFINKGELTKWLLEHDDPRNVKRFFQDPQQLAQNETEVQQNEIVRILNNFMPIIHEWDDDKAHLAALVQFYDGRMKEGAPVTPMQAQAFLQHTQLHLNALGMKKDPERAQAQQAVMPYMKILSQLAQQAAPPNVVPMQPGQAPPGGGPAAPDTTAHDVATERAETAIKAGEMLTDMIKAGVPVSMGEINTIFKELGLPQLPMPHQQLGVPTPDAIQETGTTAGQ
jgi:hypothetical protein